MYSLIRTDRYLALAKQNQPLVPVLYIDFATKFNQQRLKLHNLRNEAIAKAVGVNKYPAPLQVLDLTAGLGKDAFLLAYLGCEVTLVERNDLLVALLQDAIHRGLSCPKIKHIINNLHLIHAEAIEIINNFKNPDVIYLDPMFPENKKSAKVKLDCQILRDLLTNDVITQPNDYELLFAKAYAIANKRIVIKRHKHARPLVKLQPTFAIIGRAIRFDVYVKS